MASRRTIASGARDARRATEVRLRASGRAAHSSFPELGESAIDKLLDALMVIRGITLPEDPCLDARITQWA